jgi:hypothetical protein
VHVTFLKNQANEFPLQLIVFDHQHNMSARVPWCLPAT